MTHDSEQNRIYRFLALLASCTLKTGVKIEGCSCCGGPRAVLVRGGKDDLDNDGLYWDVDKERYTTIRQRDAEDKEDDQ